MPLVWPSAMAAKRAIFMPAKKARPSPCSTAARSPGEFCKRSIGSAQRIKDCHVERVELVGAGRGHRGHTLRDHDLGLRRPNANNGYLAKSAIVSAGCEQKMLFSAAAIARAFTAGS